MLLEWWERHRRIILSVGTILLIGSSLWLYQARSADRFGTASQLPLVSPAYASNDEALGSEETVPGEARSGPASSQPEAGEPKGSEQTAPLLYIDVKGNVNRPGLYRLDAGSRVADAIAKAGGAKPDADLEQINLAAPLTDGTAIVIPAKGGSPAAVAQDRSSPAYKPGSAGPSAAALDDQVNLNTATAEQLMDLPGIGEARAASILRYREQKGGFRSPEELKEIEGIGEKMYDRIKERLRIR